MPSWTEEIRGLPAEAKGSLKRPFAAPVATKPDPSTTPASVSTSTKAGSRTLVNMKLEYLETQLRDASKLHYELLNLSKASHGLVQATRRQAQLLSRLDKAEAKLAALDF